MRCRILIVCMAAALSGCTVGPNYRRPHVAAPPQFRGGERHPSQASLGDTKWFDLFQDDDAPRSHSGSAASQLRHPHRRAARAAGRRPVCRRPGPGCSRN